MEILCTRPGCRRPLNNFPELDDKSKLTTSQQKYCTSCGMPLILAGHYMPFRLLGRGGFGAAFLARDRYTPSLRQCVVKQFQPSGNLNEQALNIALKLFEREAMVLDTLGRRHAQIPELYAFFPLIVSNASAKKEEQFFYIVQEYIDGKNLEEEIAEKGAFSEKEVRYVLKEMLEVLQFVHENGSIHRDIKPSNMMRDRNGRLYLLDFGAVKQLTVSVNPNNPAESLLQERATGIYSPWFAPREQTSGTKIYPSSDLYALAISCLMLLSGKSPEQFHDEDGYCSNWKALVPDISEELAAIFERMLKRPSDRFQSAQEVLDALNPLPPNQDPDQDPDQGRQFSLLEILGGAAFTGFEGSLLVIALTSLISSPGIIVGFMLIGGLVFIQSRRIIEGKVLAIIAGITVLILLMPLFRESLTIQAVLMIAVFLGVISVGITSLFRLIYQLLSRSIK